MRDLMRILFGMFFIVMALLNTRLAINNPDLYDEFITEDTTLLPLYNTIWQDVVVPAMPYFLAVLVSFELLVGVLILSRGKYVRWGLLAALIFSAALIPANSYTVMNIAFIILALWLLQDQYEEDALTELRGM